MCDLDTVDLIRAYFIVIDTLFIMFVDYHIRCYGLVHTIILCILVTILG